VNGKLGALLTMTIFGWAVGPAWAGEVVTPPLIKDTFDDYACSVYNGGSKAIDVTIEIYDAAFGIPSAGPSARTIQPGRRGRLSTSLGAEDVCRVTGRFSRRKTPIAFCVIASGSGRCGATVTSP